MNFFGSGGKGASAFLQQNASACWSPYNDVEEGRGQGGPGHAGNFQTYLRKPFIPNWLYYSTSIAWSVRNVSLTRSAATLFEAGIGELRKWCGPTPKNIGRKKSDRTKNWLKHFSVEKNLAERFCGRKQFVGRKKIVRKRCGPKKIWPNCFRS